MSEHEGSQDRDDDEAHRRDIFRRIHQGIPREGPGDVESTRRAWSMLGALPDRPAILDVGCGPGLQTVEIAALSRGHVVALDSHRRYLEQLETNALAAAVRDRIELHLGSMFEMDFAEGRFDVIWAEGSIYIIGFGRGLVQWRRFLRPHGYVAVTHLSWITPAPAGEAKRFWDEKYPPITDVASNVRAARQSGYAEIGHFVLPEVAWWRDYYRPLEARLALLRDEYRHDEIARDVIEGTQSEIDLYRRYHQDYGYVFYVLRRSD